MPHILVAGPIHQAGLDLIAAAEGVTHEVVTDLAPDAYLNRLAKADGLLLRTQPLRASDIADAPGLQIVARHGVGYDLVDVDALSARGIPLAIVGDVNARTVAEHTLALMLACAKRIIHFDRATREGRWDAREDHQAIELDGKSLLIIGMGRIGRRVTELALAFGMGVLGHDPYWDADQIRSLGAEPAPDLDGALAHADFVSIHAPKTDESALIGRRELALMKPTAIVINAARGGLVDEAALIEALDGGALGGAGLDVFAEEPPDNEEALFRSDRIVISPHIAGLTRECAMRMGKVSAQNILDCFSGKLKPELIVNAESIGLGTGTGRES